MDVSTSLCTLHCVQPVLHNSVFRFILSLLAATLIYCGHPALHGGHEFGQFLPNIPCSLALHSSAKYGPPDIHMLFAQYLDVTVIL